MASKFENLKVWQEAIELSRLVSNVSKTFPHELYILTSQLKRPADAIPEFRRFLEIVIRSGIEVISCVYISKGRKIVSKRDFQLIYNGVDNLLIRIQVLRKSIK